MPDKKRVPVYVVDGLRTPQLKATGYQGEFSAGDLAVAAARQLLLKVPFSARDIDEVIMGCVMPDSSEANIARQIALRIGCNESISAWTVQRNCASGLQAIDSGVQSIRSVQSQLVMVGGTEAMSRAPILWNQAMVQWLSEWFAIRGKPLTQLIPRIGLVSRLRPSFLKPVISLLKGLTDPLVNLSMGQTAENLVHRFNISRQEMDQYAVQSHQRLAQAVAAKQFDNEIIPVYKNSNGNRNKKGKGNKSNHKKQYFDNDTGLRAETDTASLARLKAVFDKKYGEVTAGNSAQISDGATILVLASEAAVKKYHLTPQGKIIDSYWRGLSPAEMGLGPAYTIPPLLNNNDLHMDDIDYWEINEAFAAQVLACKKALNDEIFCAQELHLENRFGDIEDTKLNIDGGGISLGHPVGASGARIVLHLLNTLNKNHSKRGVASLCIGGGQGGAMLVESFK
jgi:acetyl-CoA C-acetyltransferase